MSTIIEVICNEEKKQFELWSFTEETKSLLLTQTFEEVGQALKAMMIDQLKQLGVVIETVNAMKINED